MTDKIIISRKEIEALFRRAVKGNIFQSELKDLLDKAEVSEPIGEMKENGVTWYAPSPNATRPYNLF